MDKAVIYIHGQGGNANEALHFAPLFEGFDVIGFDYTSSTPLQAKSEFPDYFNAVFKKYRSVSVIANSIGAFFAMTALCEFPIEKAYFISPIIDMQKLIEQMMESFGISQNELKENGVIKTQSGQEFSLEYYRFVKENPINWNVTTHILYGENDNMTSYETVYKFAQKTGATLTVMEGGEHWFHTDEQMRFIDGFIKSFN